MEEASSTTSPGLESNDEESSTSSIEGTAASGGSTTNGLHCIYCNEVLTKDKGPRLLPCLHLICTRCMVGKNVAQRMSCPICNEECTMANIKEFQLTDAPPVPSCGNCEELKSEDDLIIIGSASQHCIECDQDLCTKCVEAHKRTKFTRKHRLQSLFSGGMDFLASKCPTHPSKDFDLFCTTCTTAVCTECFLANHNSHAHEKMKDKIDVIQEQCRTVVNQLNEEIIRAKEPSTAPIVRMERSKETIKNDLENYCNSLQELINTKKRTILQRIEDEFVKERSQFLNVQTFIKPLIEKYTQCKVFAEKLSTYDGGISNSKKVVFDYLQIYLNQLQNRSIDMSVYSQGFNEVNENAVEKKFLLHCYTKEEIETYLNQAMTYITETVQTTTNQRPTPPTVSTNRQPGPSSSNQPAPPSASPNRRPAPPTLSANQRPPSASPNRQPAPPTLSANQRPPPPSASPNRRPVDDRSPAQSFSQIPTQDILNGTVEHLNQQMVHITSARAQLVPQQQYISSHSNTIYSVRPVQIVSANNQISPPQSMNYGAPVPRPSMPPRPPIAIPTPVSNIRSTPRTRNPESFIALPPGQINQNRKIHSTDDYAAAMAKRRRMDTNNAPAALMPASQASADNSFLNDPPKPAEVCCVCYKEGGDDEIFTDECSGCSREYHLKCHYPQLSEDIGELDSWTCRLCSDDSPARAYGMVKQKTYPQLPIYERIILKLLLIPNFSKYFGKEDPSQDKVQFVTVQKRLAQRKYVEVKHAIDDIMDALARQEIWPKEKKKVAQEAVTKLNGLLPIHLPADF